MPEDSKDKTPDSKKKGAWDTFFSGESTNTSNDFMEDCASQEQPDRESFDEGGPSSSKEDDSVG